MLKWKKVSRNILQHSLLNKHFHSLLVVVYDFETMIAETENQLKLGELRKNKDRSLTVKTGEHIPIWFA